MKEPIVLIGDGGHCKSVIDVIESGNQFLIKGIIGLPEMVGKKVLGYEVIGSDTDIASFASRGYNFNIAIGQIQSAKLRIRLFETVKLHNGKLPVIISPNAYVSKYASIAEGTIIMHYVTVNADAIIGCNNILNTGSTIEHDVTVGDHCHISTGAYANGGCKIGDNTFIGSNSTIIQEVEIGGNNIVGAGSVVIRNTKNNSLVAGNPAVFKKIISE